ncbi:MAG: hypothetical protein ACK4YP_16760 [Myxococcota bacterium]
MRKIQYIGAALLLGGCVNELLTIHIEQEGSGVVEGASVLGELLTALTIGGFDDLSVNIEQELANQGVDPGDISAVHVTELVLSTPDGEDLSFLDTIAITIVSPGLEEVRIAHAESFPEGVTSVALTLDDVDLTEYVVAESLTVNTEASGTLPAEDTTIHVLMGIDVTATVQGAAKQADRADEL